VDPVPDPPLLRKSGSAGNRTQDLWICKPSFVFQNKEIRLKMYLREIGCGGMDWINLAQDRDQGRALMNTVMNLQVP
jgi:hypothetical protein